MVKEKIMALTTISQGWKISLNKDVRENLEKDGATLKVGDKLIYILNAQGEVVLKKA